MTEERKERRFRLGGVELSFDTGDTGWVEVADLQGRMDTWTQRLQAEIDDIVQRSSFVPSRVRLRYYEPDEMAYDHYGQYMSSGLTVYGYRPETDKELAARIAKQRKKADKLLTAATAKEKQERRQLAELLAKYPEEKSP